MRAIIVFFSAGLLVYWISRVRILLHGSEAEIRETLKRDLMFGRRFVLWVR
jgi:hypothetical protein